MRKNRVIFPGCSSDVIYRTETNASSRWWNLNVRGWKYFRWISIFTAILFVLGLIIFFSVADLQSEAPSVTRKETFFDAGDGGGVGGGGGGGRLLSNDVVTLDRNVLEDLGGVTYKEANYRVTPGQPVSDNFNPDSEKDNNSSSDQDFMQIVRAPDLVISTVVRVNDSSPSGHETSKAPADSKEKSYSDFIHTIPELVIQVSTRQQDETELQENESKHIIPKKNSPYEEAEEIMMTSDRDLGLGHADVPNHRNYQATNAHSRQPVHPTIPSSILAKTKELLGDPFAAPAGAPGPNDTESTCFSTRLDMCRGVLPYDLTTLPLVPGISRLADLDAALPYFEMIVQSGCSQRATQFICSVLEPECQPMGNSVLSPCRKTCKAVAEDCSDFMLATLDLSKVFHCDLYPDVRDATQCVNLATGDVCLDDEFRCSDGSCIPSRWECDNIGDCPSSDDEANCTQSQGQGPSASQSRSQSESQSESQCTDDDGDGVGDGGQFKCKQDGKCVPRKLQCNGSRDCTDGSDELHCLQLAESGHAHASPSCPVGELRCVDGRCITMQQLCDNVSDCSDGADEGNCN